MKRPQKIQQNRKLKTRSGFSEITISAILILAFFSFTTYLNSLSNAFVFDDVYIISNNYFIRSRQNIAEIFRHEYFSVSGELSYRPVVTLSYFVDYSLWRLNPAGYHLTNVVLHTLNASLLFLLVQRIGKYLPASFVAALLFLCHPVLSEAVNAISYREDILTATFCLTSFIFFVKSQMPGKYNTFYFLSLLSYIFALFSKEMAITLPIMLFLFDFVIIHHCHFTMRTLRIQAGFLLIIVFYLFVRFFWLYNPLESDISGMQHGIWHCFLNISRILALYIKLIFFPVHLNADYLLPDIHAQADASFVLSILMIISIAVIGIQFFKKSRILFFSLLWFFITLLPVLNIIPIANAVG
jgi:hypothetical protein